MKKIINDPSDVTGEMLKGIAAAYPETLKQLDESHALIQKDIQPNTVGIVSGGGSGHEPSHAGFVGKGMLTAAVSGEVFSSPPPHHIFNAIKASDSGQGVFLIIKQYTGDVLNFEIAQEMAEAENIEVDSIIVNDDIAIVEAEEAAGSRGIAGTIFNHKILGYYAAKGLSISELKDKALEINKELNTIGVALAPATVPEVGRPGFTLPENSLEYGIGIHGEPGYKQMKMQSSNEIASELITQLKNAFDWDTGESFAVLVNGMGATPLMELYILWNDIHHLLEAEKIKTPFIKVGEFMTSLEMSGASVTLLRLKDEEWLEALNYPVEVFGW